MDRVSREPGTRGERADQRCFAGGKAVQRTLDGAQVVEGEHAVGTGAEFACGLRAAQEQQAQNSRLIPSEIQDGTDAVLILRDAGRRGRRR